MNISVNNLYRKKVRRARVRTIVNDHCSELALLQEGLELGLILSNMAHDAWALFLEDASAPGKFRYQLFTKKGFGKHVTHNSLGEALEDAYGLGYRFPDEGSLDRVAGTDEWNTGMAVQAVADRYKRGDINWGQMCSLVEGINNPALTAH